MNKNYKNYIWIACGFIVMLFLVNQWLMKQLEVVEEQTFKEPEVIAPAVIEPPVDTRVGIPIIDPDNDPLAPVKKLRQPVEINTQPASAQTDEKKVYEFPLESPILVQ